MCAAPQALLQNFSGAARAKLREWAERARAAKEDAVAEPGVLELLRELSAVLRADRTARVGAAPAADSELAAGGLPPAWAKGELADEDGNFDVLAAAVSAVDKSSAAAAAGLLDMGSPDAPQHVAYPDTSAAADICVRV